MPLVRETDEAVQPSTYEMHESRARLDTKWQMSFAVTPSGDGQSLTRCILVIAVSCATRKHRLYKLKIKGGTPPAPRPPPKIKGKEEGGKEGKKEGRKEGKRKGWQSVRRLFEKSGTCVGGGRGGRGGETRVRRRRKKRTRLP